MIKVPGTFDDGDTIFRRVGNMLAFFFRDDKTDVRILNNLYGASFHENGKPQAFYDYNLLMKGVDTN